MKKIVTVLIIVVVIVSLFTKKDSSSTNTNKSDTTRSNPTTATTRYSSTQEAMPTIQPFDGEDEIVNVVAEYRRAIFNYDTEAVYGYSIQPVADSAVEQIALIKQELDSISSEAAYICDYTFWEHGVSVDLGNDPGFQSAMNELNQALRSYNQNLIKLPAKAEKNQTRSIG